ncbi:MAG: hypothetical protein ACI8PB_001981 [Desulforhopalus sp.]|jgi:hypothetical protein
MSNTTIYPPGDKIIKAIKEYSDELTIKGVEKQNEIVQKIILKYDLSPKESAFMEKHFQKQ